MEEIFETFDENGDGNITMGELRRFLKKSGKILSADELKAVITAMDSSGNTNHLHISPFVLQDDMNLHYSTT